MNQLQLQGSALLRASEIASMAVTQKADSNSKKTVEEPVQHCGGQGADSGRCGLTRKRISDDPSTRPEGIRKDDSGVVRRRKLGGNIVKAYKSDTISDIDDNEIMGYIRTKEETHIKKILWEAMNEKYMKDKQKLAAAAKKAAATKKATSIKKATKTTEKVEPQKRSSRINYDALKSLDVDLGSCESSQTLREDPYAHGPKNSTDGNISPRMHESNESWSEEDEEEEEEEGCDISYGNNGTYENDEYETNYYNGYDEDFDNDFD